MGAFCWRLLSEGYPPAPAAPVLDGLLRPVLPCHLAGCPVICAEAALAVLDAPSAGTFLAFALLLAAASVFAFLAGLACGLWACWLTVWGGGPASGVADASIRHITPYLRASREAR